MDNGGLAYSHSTQLTLINFFDHDLVSENSCRPEKVGECFVPL
jgi:hypothetical protein